MTYDKYDTLLTGRNRDSKKLGNNTYAVRRENAVAIRLHSTDVVTFHADGSITLNSGGWKTVTTKERLNSYSGMRVSQSKGVWTVHTGGESVPYFDGITFRDGVCINPPKQSELDKEAALRKRILKYSKVVADALPIAKPNGGDCWYCHMREVNTGKPLGECNGDTSHLLSHMDEKYVVPSLVWRAIEHAGCNPQGNGCAWFAYAFDNNITLQDWSRAKIGRMVKKYLYRQFGLVS